MWKLNIVSWQINFVVISRPNRRSFRLVEIHLKSTILFVRLLSDIKEYSVQLTIPFPWINA